MGIVLKNGTIVTAADEFISDLRIEDDKIVSIGTNINLPHDEIIDVNGCYVLPGGIDTHTHFDLAVASTVTADNFYTGTKAAVAGGTTTILDYATQSKGHTLKEALELQHIKSNNNCFCDYGFHMGITDWNKNTSSEILDMINEGVTSFKMYMAYKDTLQVSDDNILEALIKCKEFGALVSFHCENGHIIHSLIRKSLESNKSSPYYHHLTRPPIAEKEAISRLLDIANLANYPINIVHLSSKIGYLEVLNGLKNGVQVLVETCPQYLLLDKNFYGEENSNSFEGAKYVMSPPLREKEDQEALWNGIKSGNIITIGTDHCSFNYNFQKELGKNDFSKIPNGAPGVEHRLLLLYTYGVVKNKISMSKFVAITSTNAAKLFGLYPKKGTIAVGSDADIVVFDPSYNSIITAKNSFQNVDYTPYEGFDIKGRVLHLWLRGNILIKDGKFIENNPKGKYLYRKPSLK